MLRMLTPNSRARSPAVTPGRSRSTRATRSSRSVRFLALTMDMLPTNMTVDVRFVASVSPHLNGEMTMHDGSEAPRGGVVIEWAPFRLREGVTEAQLLEASEAIQREFLARQAGFLHRELARGADNLWADVVHW